MPNANLSTHHGQCALLCSSCSSSQTSLPVPTTVHPFNHQNSPFPRSHLSTKPWLQPNTLATTPQQAPPSLTFNHHDCHNGKCFYDGRVFVVANSRNHAHNTADTCSSSILDHLSPLLNHRLITGQTLCMMSVLLNYRIRATTPFLISLVLATEKVTSGSRLSLFKW